MSTQIQYTVAQALGTLGLESLPTDPPNLMGAPSRFRVSDETIQKFKEMVGKTIEVTSDGSVTVK
jgi:hypothetical protein